MCIFGHISYWPASSDEDRIFLSALKSFLFDWVCCQLYSAPLHEFLHLRSFWKRILSLPSVFLQTEFYLDSCSWTFQINAPSLLAFLSLDDLCIVSIFRHAVKTYLSARSGWIFKWQYFIWQTPKRSSIFESSLDSRLCSRKLQDLNFCQHLDRHQLS